MVQALTENLCYYANRLVIVRGFESIKDNHQSDEDLANLFQGWFRGAQVIIFNSCPRNSIRPGWIQKQSDELLSILINDRQSFTQVVGESSRSRPIVILASNVGGFVVKRALVQATNNWQYQSIISSTIAVVFLGTPHTETQQVPWEAQLMHLILAFDIPLLDPSLYCNETSSVLRGLSVWFSIVDPKYFIGNYITNQERGSSTYHYNVLEKYPTELCHPSGREVPIEGGYESLWTFSQWEVKSESVRLLISGLRQLSLQAADSHYYLFLGSLAPRDPAVHQFRGYSTGFSHLDQIRDHDIYKKWLTSDFSNFLSISADAGSGTRSLLYQMMQSLIHERRGKRDVFISFSYDNQYVRDKVESLYLSLCRQLLMARPLLYQRMSKLCKWLLTHTIFTPATAMVLLRSLLGCYTEGPVYCFIYNVDQSGEVWQDFVAQMEEISRSQSTPLKVAFTLEQEQLVSFTNSRIPQEKDPILASSEKSHDSVGSSVQEIPTPQPAPLKAAFTIKLEQPTNSTDNGHPQESSLIVDLGEKFQDLVRLSVQERLRHDTQRSALWTKFETAIANSICQRPTTFLVMTLQLDLLQSSSLLSSRSSITEALESLPIDLDGVYEYFLGQISMQDYQRQALNCIASAVRPINSSELAVYLSLGSQKCDNLESLEDRIPCDMIGDLINSPVLRRLLKVQDDHLYLIHGTLSNYIAVRDSEGLLQLQMLETCLNYLALFPNDSEKGEEVMESAQARSSGGSPEGVVRRVAERHCFLAYATDYWPQHYINCKASAIATAAVLNFVQSCSLQAWASAYNSAGEPLNRVLEEPVTPLTVASTFGFEQIAIQVLGTNQSQEAFTENELDIAVKLAAMHGHLKTLELLLTRGANGAYALGYACAGGQKDLVEHILAGDDSLDLDILDLDIVDSDGLTPLLQSLRSGHPKTAEYLLSKGASPAAKPSDGLTSLHLATQLGLLEIVRILVDKKVDIEAENSSGYDALKIAAESGFRDIVSYLLDNRAKALINKPTQSTNKSALYLAVAHGHQQTTICLLNNGADPRITDLEGDSPLYVACRDGFVSIVQLLRSQVEVKDSLTDQKDSSKQDSDPEPSGSTAFPTSSATQYQEGPYLGSSSERAAGGKGPQKRLSRILSDCLQVAARKGHLEIVSLLLDGPIDPQLTDDHGETALHAAAAQGYDQTTKQLLAKGFRVDQGNKRHETPLQIACDHGHVAVVQVLVDGTAVIDWSSKESEASKLAQHMPLQLAARSGHVDVMDCLVRKGARPSASDLKIATSRRQLPTLRKFISLSQRGIFSLAVDDVAPSVEVALDNGFTPALKELLVSEIFGDGLKKLPEHVRSALHQVYRRGNVETVRTLVDTGLDLNMRQDDQTPLYAACTSGSNQERIMEILLDFGAKINETNGDYEETALYTAASYGRLAIVQLLLNRGADPRIREKRYGCIPLHAAYDNAHVTKALLNKDATLVNEKSTSRTTALMLAAQNECVDTMRILLEYKADVEAKDKDGRTALHKACNEGGLESVRFLLSEGGANPDMKSDDEGATALHYAAAEGNVAMLKLLMTEGKADVAVTNNDGATAMHLAAGALRLKAVEYLIDKVESLDVQTDDGSTPLEYAIDALRDGLDQEQKCLAICETLIKRGPKFPKLALDKFPLRAAIETESLLLVKLMLQNNAEVNRIEGEAGTPLLVAIGSGQIEIVKTLIKHGADPNLKANGCFPLQAAVEAGWELIVTYLLTYKTPSPVDPNRRTETGDTLLRRAALQDRVPIVEALVKNGADVGNVTHGEDGEKSEMPLLIYSLKWRSSDVVKYLIENAESMALSLDAKTKAGDSALHLAVARGRISWVHWLLDRGADVNLVDSLGRTPLIIAVASSKIDIAILLLGSGGDPGIRDGCHRDALYWACLCGNMKIFENICSKLREKEDWARCYSAALHATVSSNQPDMAILLINEFSLSDSEDRNGWTIIDSVRYCGLDSFASLLASKLSEENAHKDSSRKRPSSWNCSDKHPVLDVKDNGLTVCVNDKLLEDILPDQCSAAIRADCCMPGEGIYYFEVKINECPPEQEKIIGIGFSTEGASVSSFVGYDSGSWGYHGSDGKVYLERYFGQLYAGITYGVRDTIGCGVDFDRGTAFFTRNGKHLGEAFGVPKRKLYPTVSFDTLKPLMGEGGSITAKFEEPFVCLNYASYTVANEGYNIGRSRTLLRR